jgi:hypothetical protein
MKAHNEELYGLDQGYPTDMGTSISFCAIRESILPSPKTLLNDFIIKQGDEFCREKI